MFQDYLAQVALLSDVSWDRLFFLSPDISPRQYRRVVMAPLLLRLRDLRESFLLRGDRKDQLQLQRKEEGKYIEWINMLRKLVGRK